MRHIACADIKDVIEALYAGGVRIVEITFDPSKDDTIKDVAKSFQIAREMYGDKICVGAGTVLSKKYAEAAYNASAEFIVSPCTDKRIIAYTKEHGMLSMPGAYSPTEIMNAYGMGADIVKIFPVLPDNIDYLKTIMSPLSHIPFVPTGGINPKTIKEFLNTGAIAVAAGATIVNTTIIKNKQFEIITQSVKEHINGIKETINNEA